MNAKGHSQRFFQKFMPRSSGKDSLTVILPAMKHPNCFHQTAIIVALTITTTIAKPLIDSWHTADSGRYARIFETVADESAENSVTTWNRGQGVQAQPTYVGIHEVSHDATSVYIRTTGSGTINLDPNKTDPVVPGTTIPINTITLGGVNGTSITRPSRYVAQATFVLPNQTGPQSVEIIFTGPQIRTFGSNTAFQVQ